MTQSYVNVLITQRPDDVPILKARISATPPVKQIIELLARAAQASRELEDLSWMSLSSPRGVGSSNDLDLRRLSLSATPRNPVHQPLSAFTGDHAPDADE